MGPCFSTALPSIALASARSSTALASARSSTALFDRRRDRFGELLGLEGRAKVDEDCEDDDDDEDDEDDEDVEDEDACFLQTAEWW